LDKIGTDYSIYKYTINEKRDAMRRRHRAAVDRKAQCSEQGGRNQNAGVLWPKVPSGHYPTLYAVFYLCWPITNKP